MIPALTMYERVPEQYWYVSDGRRWFAMLVMERWVRTTKGHEVEAALLAEERP
jgi:hypothetical protein